MLEIEDDASITEHCMAGTGSLRLSAREMIALSRLLTMARRMKLGWAGVATPDERMASIHSRVLTGKASQELKAVSHPVVASARLRIPGNYRRLETTPSPQSKQQPAKTQQPSPAQSPPSPRDGPA